MSKATTVALLLLAVAVPLTLCQENLPVGFSFPENFIVKNTMTVSGISAGGAMAVQFHFAHSSIVHGAAVVAGLPFYCSRGSIIGAGECMFVGKLIDTKQLMDTALKYESEGLIDPLRNIANQPVFLWSGRDDIIVQPPAMHAVQKMYQSLNVTSSLVSYFNFSAEHAWPVSVGGNSCGHLGPPFINNCVQPSQASSSNGTRHTPATR
jgi:hypothetical protein